MFSSPLVRALFLFLLLPFCWFIRTQFSSFDSDFLLLFYIWCRKIQFSSKLNLYDITDTSFMWQPLWPRNSKRRFFKRQESRFCSFSSKIVQMLLLCLLAQWKRPCQNKLSCRVLPSINFLNWACILISAQNAPEKKSRDWKSIQLQNRTVLINNSGIRPQKNFVWCSSMDSGLSFGDKEESV